MGGKAKRARERLRMENEQQIFERLKGWFEDIDNMPEGPFNSCNMDVVGEPHTDDCTGDCEPMDKYAVGIHYEDYLCKRMGFNHLQQLNSNSWQTETKIIALIEVLKDKGIVTQDEVDVMYRKAYYTRLNHIRLNELPQAIQNAQREAARRQIITPGGPANIITRPNGHK